MCTVVKLQDSDRGRPPEWFPTAAKVWTHQQELTELEGQIPEQCAKSISLRIIGRGKSVRRKGISTEVEQRPVRHAKVAAFTS